MTEREKGLIYFLLAIVAIPAVLVVAFHLVLEMEDAVGFGVFLVYAKIGTLVIGFLGLLYIAIQTSTNKEKKHAAILGNIFGTAFLMKLFGASFSDSVDIPDSQKSDENQEKTPIEKKRQGGMVARCFFAIVLVYAVLEGISYMMK